MSTQAPATAVGQQPVPQAAAHHTAHPHETDGTTRRHVLELVASEGPVTAAHLASTLGLTAPAVRRHLTLLEEEGRIGVHEGQPGPARRGRPARHYVVTHGGQSELAGGYQEIAADLLRHLRAHGGDEAVAAFAKERYDAVARRYSERIDADDVAGRAAQLAVLLTEDGYAASVRPVPTPARLSGERTSTVPSGDAPSDAAAVAGTTGPGVFHAVQLCQGHCPVQHLAEEHTELCEAEARAFTELLGTHVQRLATIAGGAHACTTNIPLGATTHGTATTTEGTR